MGKGGEGQDMTMLHVGQDGDSVVDLDGLLQVAVARPLVGFVDMVNAQPGAGLLVPCSHTNTHNAGVQTHNNTPAYPKTLLSVLQTDYVRIFRFLTGFFADAPPISQNKTVPKVKFSISQLVRTVFELTYRCTTLKRLYFVYVCESCSRLKTAEHFLQKQCTMCAAFADANASFPEWLLSGQSLFPWFRAFFLLFLFHAAIYHQQLVNPPCIGRGLTSVKFRWTNFLDQSGLVIYFSPGNGFKCANVKEW